MEKDIIRCDWCGNDPLYIKYHDEEWGKETKDDNVLFEFMILESAQAGLSWITILRKREGYRKAFADFNIEKVSKLSDKVDDLLKDESIIRNRLKIQSAISNAKLFLDIQKEFGSFYNYIIGYFPNKKRLINNWTKIEEVPASSDISDVISKDMKKRGFKFFGTTICYAYLQATGFIDDHLINCNQRR